ncbi:zinc finger protein 271-like [Toxorhynchites rutilus septentrionalis]|uniref:zinc finger protein 271-like n=1 Tax=Toxorhynchites rutilus septentrionalis TaxID=329112 RepID=UPI002479D310|nr:zinc finger protein 271-like [Toxorhynchites rutilus septentrionalis]XP_055641807.1 zinc finger protein 271-like [Toxorhynchites rutilus septentrionalis]
MKENPMVDVFDGTDFNPDMILSNVFLDPGLDFMTSIDELSENIMAQDFLHFGNSLFYSEQQQQQQQQPAVDNGQLQGLQNQQQLPQHQQQHLVVPQQPKCAVEQKPSDGANRYDPTITTTATMSAASDYVKQAVVPQVATMAPEQPPKTLISQIAQQQQQQQSCKCEFCEYLQANRISLSGSGGSGTVVGEDHVFQCEFCGEGFANQGSFNRHRCGSTDIQVYRCESCRREYGTSRTESNINGFEGRGKCDICNKNYVQSTTGETGGMTLYGQVGHPALAEANSYATAKASVVDSPMEHDLSSIEPFGSESECISELLTEGPSAVESHAMTLPGKTYFVLGNVELQQMNIGITSGVQNAKISSESNVTSLHQYDQYEDEDYSSMSEDEAIVPIEPYAKSPKQEQAKTELPIQETIIDTSSNVGLPFSASTASGAPTEEEGKCDSSSKGTDPVQPDRPFKCHICERSYRNHKNLKAHIKGAHEGIRANQCEICGKNFSGSSYLVIHRRRHTGERPFKCTTCGKAFVDSRALSVHTRLHTPGNRLKCMKCEKTFSSASALTVHNRLHTGIHPYKCEICEKTFPQYNNLKHHMKKHEAATEQLQQQQQQQQQTSSLEASSSPNSNSSSVGSSSCSPHLEYKCNVCGKPSGSSEELQTHLNQHCKDRPNQCEFCSKVFPRSSHLIIHRRRHTGERPFKCKYCEKAFVDSRALSVHTRLHTGERVTCDICLKTFASSSGLIVHRRIHLGIHPYKCDYCPKSFAQSTALKYHLKKHDTTSLPTTTDGSDGSGRSKISSQHNDASLLSDHSSDQSNPPTAGSPEPAQLAPHSDQQAKGTSDHFKCQVCNKIFRSAEYLARHRRTHSGERPFQCEICGKNFSTMSYLVIHRRRHTSERPYKCPHGGCTKAFVDSRALQKHSRSVHSKIRVPCEFCPKTYSSVSNLIVHRRIHSGVHPFECDICGRSFAQKNTLKYHLNQHVGKHDGSNQNL